MSVPQPEPTKRVVVRLLLSVPESASDHDIAYECYKAVIAATLNRYFVLGYDWTADK
jgi:hypothetical protein